MSDTMSDTVTRFTKDMDGYMEPCENGDWVLYEDFITLQEESLEQSRLLGMSAEREMSLLAKCDALEKRISRLRGTLQHIRKMDGHDHFEDVLFDVQGAAKTALNLDDGLATNTKASASPL